jgi:hypothetical protein
MLATGQFNLKSDLRKAYKNAEKNGETGDPIPQLADEMGTAIYDYMITAKVKTVVTILPGQPYISMFPGNLGPGGPPNAVTSSPGSGKGEGTIDFDSSAVDALISALEEAFYAAEETGSTGGDVMEQLSTDVSTAIYEFAIKAKVDTSVKVDPGQVLTQYIAMVPAAPSPIPTPVPATTQKGTGSGVGLIS